MPESENTPRESGGEVLGPSNLKIRWCDLTWYYVAFAIFTLAIIARFAIPISQSEPRPLSELMSEARPRGFDVSNIVVDRDYLVLSGLPKDGLYSLVNPEAVKGTDVEELNKKQRRREHRKFIIPDDRVIGVVIGGEARAYPARFLNWHEIANDTLGGTPIAVTYSPLCDSVAVFDRRVDGEVLEFGISGLLYNSNLVMYDRRGDERLESLWGQLEMRAISGPMAGTKLRPIPAQLTRWGLWLEEHPGTTLITGEPKMKENYSLSPYQNYFKTEKIRYPVSPMPVAEDKWKTRIVAIGAGGVVKCFFLTDDDRNPLVEFSASVEVGGVALTLEYLPPTLAHEPEALIVGGTGLRDVEFIAHSFYGAWYAAHPDAEFAQPAP